MSLCVENSATAGFPTRLYLLSLSHNHSVSTSAVSACGRVTSTSCMRAVVAPSSRDPRMTQHAMSLILCVRR